MILKSSIRYFDMEFCDREEELKELERVWNLCDKSMHFTVISGRRRIGKTELVKQFCRDKENFYFFIGRKNLPLLLEELSSIVRDKVERFPTLVKFDEFLELLLGSVKKKTIIFFDEFQNFKYVDESAFSDFQKIFDRTRDKLQVHLIVAGSHVSLITKIFSDSKEPLFGRATEKYLLKPLSFRSVSQMLESIGIKDIEEKIMWHGVFGGVPKYYVIAEEQGVRGDIFSALKVLLFRDLAPLKDEAKSILLEEFGSEHPSYFSILEAVALGNSEMTTIANKAGINIKSISKYLGLLVRDFGYLSYEVPITERKPWKSKKGRYFLGDNFLRFWFRYIYRNRSEYEIGSYDSLLRKIKLDFNSLVGKGFEEISKEFLVEKRDALPFRFEKIGKWWQRGGEIDLVALSEESKEIALFECMWSELSKRDADKILSDLKRKTALVEWRNSGRKERYGIIAKDVKGKEEFRSEGYIIYDLKDFDVRARA